MTRDRDAASACYCGDLSWTVKNYGRVTHKEGCPARTDPWHQGDPDAGSAAFDPDVPVDCDAPNASVYMTNDKLHCRCVVCARCGKHTGNAHQGHYWSFCSKTRQNEGFHFCCPDMPCEYEEAANVR